MACPGSAGALAPKEAPLTLEEELEQALRWVAAGGSGRHVADEARLVARDLLARHGLARCRIDVSQAGGVLEVVITLPREAPRVREVRLRLT